jgi:hypothetical protein
VLRRLRAPVSGLEFLRLAEALREENPKGALEAADEGLRLRVGGEGIHPYRTAHRMRGDLLARLDAGRAGTPRNPACSTGTQ